MNGMGNDSRVLARTVFVVVLVTFVTLLIMAGMPMDIPSFAQATASPSGASPTPTGAVSYQIEFINPSGSGHNEIMSAQDDMSEGPSDQKYHLVAWISSVPDNVRVEFKYRLDGENEERLIGLASQAAPGDTFDFQWQIDGEIPEGQGGFVLIAILYSGSTELDRDTEDDITKNDSSPPNPDHPEDTSNRAQGIELTYPTNGGDLGFFRPKDMEPNAVFVITRTVPADNNNPVLSRYTVSPPGSEPIWKTCAGTTIDATPRCVLAAGDDFNEVTAVAVFAQSRTCGPGACTNIVTHSGDAHRVLPYNQAPATVTISPEQQNERSANACSGNFSVEVKDEKGRPIAAAPIDVHAQGPTDELFFSAASGEPPENHKQEEAVACADLSASSVKQGDHDDPAGIDLKHSESPTATSDLGIYTFALWSPDPGVTQLTAWVDLDEDDQFCSTELSVDASIGWQIPAPAPSGPQPEETECPVPTPSPFPSRTRTPSPTDSPGEDPRGCTVLGTQDSETLIGTDEDDIICSYGGNDIVEGRGGNDVIYGDEGADELRGGGGNDFIEGGAGKDTLRGGGGSDELEGGGQNDTIAGGGGNDSIKGQDGFDSLTGSKGNDFVSGGTGDDIANGGAGNDRMFGGPGKDILDGARGRDRCRGGPGNDKLKSC